MAKADKVSPEDRLAVLRAELDLAQSAAASVPEDASDDDKAAAVAVVEKAEAALREAHLDAQKREEDAREVREEALEVAVVLSLYDIVNSASTQNVRGTDSLSPEQHSARRNPTP